MELIKFKEMPYTRPDPDEIRTEMAAFTEALKKADSYDTAKEVFLKEQKLEKHVMTMETLASIRHSIDTRDTFYDKEEAFWNNANPQIREYMQKWTEALLESPFRPAFAQEYGEVMFTNAEIDMKAFSPAIIPEMQEEAELTTEYMKVIASAQIPFRGGIYTLSQLSPFKNDADDEVRLAAWKAEGAWYKEHQE